MNQSQSASKMCRSASPKTNVWMSVDEYSVAYYPETSFNDTLYKAKKGYHGSSKDHFYSNSGLHRLGTRHLRCMCSHCVSDVSLFSSSCSLKAWCGTIRHYNLEPDTSPIKERVRLRRDICTLEEFAEGDGMEEEQALAEAELEE